MPIREMLLKNAFVQLLLRIFRHFDTVPEAIALEHYRFYIISNIGYTIGWMIHVLWLGIFFYLGQYTLMWCQLLSIGCHVLAIVLNRRGIHQTAMATGMLEVVAHQVLAVHILGWGAGFQYIIIAISLFPFLKHDGSMIIKSLLVLMCAAGYLYLEVYVKYLVPVSPLNVSVESIFNYSNIILCFGFIATWGFFITVAIKRSEDILIQRNNALYEAEKATERAQMQRQLEVKERDMEIYRLRNVELKNSNDEIALRNKMIEEEKQKSEALLMNILPEQTAYELLREGVAKSREFEQVTIMFTDFVDFTVMAGNMKADDLVKQMDMFFRAFDEITLKYGVEKIKTIGDAYMCAGGLPVENTTHPTDVLKAAIDIRDYMQQHEALHFRIRIGVHTGPVAAGVVGRHKFQYDIWGDAVNIAARMEQNSAPGRINISGATYELIKGHFNCEYRGKVNVKNKGDMDMYFVL